ncbi:hypothetical protein MJM43_33120, partial [Salmonella enterica subsp. enterica serovar Montevideo]|nr:hypothetical protein [Salmonella enterica subsp. enterica serovar Montevideo]
LLKGLGVWEAVQGMRSHPYRRLETWEWENAHVVFDAAELKLPSSAPPFHHRWRYYPSVGDFATAGVYDRTVIFCCGDGTRESS